MNKDRLLPSMSEIRAEYAQVALDAYASNHDEEFPLRDLLADLVHSCIHRKVDFFEKLHLALKHVEMELFEDEWDGDNELLHVLRVAAYNAGQSSYGWVEYFEKYHEESK